MSMRHGQANDPHAIDVLTGKHPNINDIAVSNPSVDHAVSFAFQRIVDPNMARYVHMVFDILLYIAVERLCRGDFLPVNRITVYRNFREKLPVPPNFSIRNKKGEVCHARKVRIMGQQKMYS